MKTDLFDTVQARLELAGRAWQCQRAMAWLLRGWKWLVLAVGLLLVADLIFHLGDHHRLALDLLFATALLGLAGWLAYAAWVQVTPHERIARLLESRSPELGSKLINLLQVRETFLATPHDNPLTRSLAAQAVDDAAEAVQPVRFLPLTKDPAMKRYAQHAAWPCLLFILLAGFFFRAFEATAVRFLDPYGGHPPYSLTQIQLEKPDTVLYGSRYTVKARWTGHDPKELFLTAHAPGQPGDKLTLPMIPQERGVFVQTLDNVRSSLVIHAHTRGDWSRSRAHSLTVIMTPQFERATVAIQAPEYTRLPEKKSSFTFNGITALNGSRVTVTLRSNRPLQEGQISLMTNSGPASDLTLTPDPENLHEVSGTFTAEASGRMTFSLTDATGIPSDALKTSALTVTHDLAPQVSIAAPARDGVVVEGFPLLARVQASDDYGLKLMRVHVGRNGTYEPPLQKEYSQPSRSESISVPLMDGPKPPKAGDIILLFAEAIDIFPTPHVARTETRMLQVISREQYQDYLRQEHSIAELEAKYDTVFREHQRLLEEQKKLADEARKLAEQKEQRPEEAEALQRRQDQLNKDLMQSADAMDTFVSDSPLYDVEASFAEQLKEQAAQVRDSVAMNEAAARDAASAMAQAAKDHHERMAGAEQEAREEIQRALADLSLLQELVNDFNHFKALFERQQQLTAQSEAYGQEAVLDETSQLAVQSLGAVERAIGEALRDLAQKLRDDAARAMERFPKAAASGESLAQAMEEARMDYLAAQASGKMLRGDGRGGNQGALRLLHEMQELFGQCNSGQGGMSDELDTCLSLAHGMNAGATFEQMMQCRKFGFNRGTGMGAEGTGMGGFMMGDSVMGGASVYGAESTLGRVNNGSGEGLGESSPGGAATASIVSSDVNTAPAEVNRATDAVPGSTLIEQYRSLTEAYFDRITGTPPQQQEEKP